MYRGSFALWFELQLVDARVREVGDLGEQQQLVAAEALVVSSRRILESAEGALWRGRIPASFFQMAALTAPMRTSAMGFALAMIFISFS